MQLTVESYFEICLVNARENYDDSVSLHFPDQKQIIKHIHKFPWDLSSIEDALDDQKNSKKLMLLLHQLIDTIEQLNVIEQSVITNHLTKKSVSIGQLMELIKSLAQ